MTDTMPIETYLEQGGKLGAPDNVPARYRGELMRLMSSFVDSELAGSAGFAGAINHAPGIKERIAASRIVLEKADHAERVLDLMAGFGTDKARYNSAHDWAARGEREANVGTRRQGGDMRLSVFHYPLSGWTDAVVMNALMGLATVVQLSEFIRCSYTPLADALRGILPRETRHADLGFEGLERIARNDGESARASIDYWMPRVAETFGQAGSGRFDTLRRMGLRHTSNESLLADWRARVAPRLADLALS